MGELLSAVVARRFADFTTALEEAVAGLPAHLTPKEELRAKCEAYVQFGLGRPGEYELLFGRGGPTGVAYVNSAGESAFADLVAAVARVTADDPTTVAATLWPALHGIVTTRTQMLGFPWPPLGDQISRIVDGLVHDRTDRPRSPEA